MIKRAPGGFVGMRGKKDTYSNPNMASDQDSLDFDGFEDGMSFPWQNLPNSGMEGNNADGDNDDLFNWDEYAKPNGRRYKKAPTAFYGVRGKKYTPGSGIDPSGDSYRWNQFLQKLDEDRMREMIMGNIMGTLLENNRGEDDEDAQNEIAKRAPTGFTGVRGKRPALSVDDSAMESAAKRGLGNAFVGVRGKKDVSHQTFKRSPMGSEVKFLVTLINSLLFQKRTMTLLNYSVIFLIFGKSPLPWVVLVANVSVLPILVINL